MRRALLLWGVVVLGTAHAQVFTELFEESVPPAHWTVVPDPATNGFRWFGPSELPGFHYQLGQPNPSTKGVGVAHTPWAIGTNAFEFTYRARFYGLSERWRTHGIYVGLTSAAPGTMGSNDISILWAVISPGPLATVRRGPLLTNDVDLSRLYIHQNGDVESVTWPDPVTVIPAELTLHVQRDPTNLLTFTVYHHQLPGGTTNAWWQGKWKMSTNIVHIPLTHVVVKPYGGWQPTGGTVFNLRARALTAAAAPVITNIVAGQTVLGAGATLTLLGRNFQPGGTARVGGVTGAVTFVNSGEVHVTLPERPANQRHRLTFYNADGQGTEYEPGVPYGRLLERCEPREVGLTGGEVTVFGGGIETHTVILFNGQPATLLQRISPFAARVLAPPGAEGRATVTAGGFAGAPVFGYAGHPYLFYRAHELADLRAKFNEPAFANYRATLLNAAARETNTTATAMQSQLWAYLLTGNASYRERLLPMVRATAQARKVSEFNQMLVEALAMVYDTMFAELSLADRELIADYLELGMSVYLNRVKANSWWYANNPSNTIAVGGAGSGLAGLALRFCSNWATQAVTVAPATVKSRYRSMTSDGGCVEGTLYWNYGLTAYLRLAHALRNATGNDQGMLGTTALSNTYRFVETQLGGDGEFFTFNDTQPWLTGWAICADAGSRLNQPLLLWLADHMAAQFAAQGTNFVSETARGDISPYAFLWRSRQPAPPAFPGVPTASALSVLHWGVLRSSSFFTPGLVAGIKGQGGTLTHHAQNDLGSFVVQARGEPFLIDPGYYQPATNAHTLPVIDGRGPTTGNSSLTNPGARITNIWETGHWRGLTVDPTPAYHQLRVRRHFVMAGDRALVVLDDLMQSNGAPGQVTAQYQCGYPTTVLPGGRAALINGLNSRVAVQVFGPALTLTATGPRDFGSSWIFKRRGVQWYSLTGTYVIETNNPLVTVITPLAWGEPLPAVSVSRVGDGLTVELPASDRVTFAHGPSGWQPATVANLDPQADADGDGQSNAAELQAGTNPLEAGSVLQITRIAGNSVSFPTVAGRRYEVEYCDDLATGHWQSLPGGAGRVTGTGGEWTVTDPTVGERSRRFYRVRLTEW